MRPSHRFLLVVVVLVISGATSCSGADSDAGPDSSATQSTTSVTTTTAAGRASPGCAEPSAGPAPADGLGDVALTIDSDGVERSFRLAVPTTEDPEVPAPLVVDLHGAGSNAQQQSAYSAMSRVASADGWFVVTPDAIDGRWELAATGADDRFLIELVDAVAAEHCIDLDRVHASGISLGAWKATITACTHPDRFASIALVAESVAPPDCAVPVVAFHGTADRVVPYGEGADPGIEVTGSNATLPGVEVNLPAWATNAGCDAEPERTAIGDDVEHWVYSGCPPGRGVEFYRIEGGGHTWPGSALDIAYLGSTTQTIDATAIALDWFERHPLAR